MPEPNPQTTYTQCAQPECPESLPDHGWGRIKADNWFQQRNGDIWCPNHRPEWYAAWRARQKKDARS